MKKDLATLKLFSKGSEDKFFEGANLESPIAQFLYGNKGVSFLGQVGSEPSNDIQHKIIAQQDGVFTVLYFREKDRESVESVKLLEEQWMKKYLACELARLPDGSFVFHENLCFAETGGPFAGDYG